MGVRARCLASVPVIDPVDGGEAYETCDAMRVKPECGPRGLLWERGGIVGWLDRFVMHGEARP